MLALAGSRVESQVARVTAASAGIMEASSNSGRRERLRSPYRSGERGRWRAPSLRMSSRPRVTWNRGSAQKRVMPSSMRASGSMSCPPIRRLVTLTGPILARQRSDGSRFRDRDAPLSPAIRTDLSASAWGRPAVGQTAVNAFAGRGPGGGGVVVDGRDEHASRVANGPLKGKTIDQLVRSLQNS